MKILIAGAEGQMGRALQEALRNHTLFPFGRQDLDITDASAVRRRVQSERPDVVINAAAYNNVDKAEEEPTAAFVVNEQGAGNLAQAAQENGAVIVHYSTDYVFDGTLGRPYKESDAPNPLSVYGKSKLAGEMRVREKNPRHFIIRTAWVFHTQGKNFFTIMMSLSQKGPVRVVNDQISSPTYAPHLADATARLMTTQAYGRYHMAGAGAASRYDQLTFLFQELGTRVAVEPISTKDFPQKAPRPRNSALETEKKPGYVLPPWQQGVKEYAMRISKV